jgi:quercetin dioxygenase-like cupin family protein
MTGRVSSEGLPPIEGSPLSLTIVGADADAALALGDAEADSLVYVIEGDGSLGENEELAAGTAALVLAGEEAVIRAGRDGLRALLATVGPAADRHAPLGPRETVARLDAAETSSATGSRSFHVLFGPHNGSTGATLFAGFVPPGRAPWHFHLYDEIVWVPDGPGRLHIRDGVEELGAGSAFRLRPREVHIVENPSPDRELTILGVFTPAGSPAAAYLAR